MRRPILVLLLLAIGLLAHRPVESAEACYVTRWSPSGVGLKDHAIFRYAGAYYLASIHLSDAHYEDQFAYARSADLCNFEVLPGILSVKQGGKWDNFRVWAPHVVEHEGTFYMYYTGVAEGITQSTLLATTTNPADPTSWQRQPLVVHPTHQGAVWPGYGQWSNMRDPWIEQVGDTWFLYYTGQDQNGAIIGYATAPSPAGPWTDHGATLLEPTGAMLESPGVFYENGRWYLFYNHTGNRRGEIRSGPTPIGPWSAPGVLPHAMHEFWRTFDGRLMASFIEHGYRLSIRPVSWYAGWPMLYPVRTWLPIVGQ